MRFLAKSTQKVKHNDYAEADASDESDGDTSSDDSDNGRSECDDPENIDLIEGDQKRNWTQLEGVRSYYAWRWARDDDNAGYLDENGVPRFTVSMCKNVFVAKPIWDKHVVAPFHSVVYAYTERSESLRERFVTIKEPVFAEGVRIAKGSRVAVYFNTVDDEELDHWFTGTVREIRNVQTSKIIGKEQFMKQFVIDFDGTDPGEKRVVVEDGAHIRRIQN